MQEMQETLTVGGVECRRDALGPRRVLGHARQALSLQGVDDVAHRLDGATHHLGKRLGGQVLGAGEDNLCTAHAERIRHTALSVQLRALIIGHGSNIERWFHSLIVLSDPLLHKAHIGFQASITASATFGHLGWWLESSDAIFI
jgi:hypothetical protein